MKRNLGLSTNGKVFNKDLLLSFADSGINITEISLEAGLYNNLDFNQIASWSSETGVELWSLHLPYWPFKTKDISSLDEVIRKTAIENHKKLIKDAANIGIKIFVLHPSAEPIEDNERVLRLKNAKKSIDELAEYADKLGTIIALENLPRTCLGNCSSEMEYLTNHSKARICFDTNHLLNEEHDLFIQNVGKKIITTHISDFDGINERHWLPGEGIIDWVKLITELDKIGYAGPLLYEVAYRTPETIKRPRDLENADFVQNFNALQDKSPFPTIKL